MAYEQRDNSGSVFVNNRKEKDSHPDRTGTAMIDGVEYWVSGWIKQGKNGQFLSLAFKKREHDENRQASERKQSYGDVKGRANAQRDMDDSIPF